MRATVTDAALRREPKIEDVDFAPKGDSIHRDHQGAYRARVGDRTLMLQYSTYSVISPEGCASILWKSADKARDAAEALGLTAPRLLEHKLIDRIVPEPLGGAHRDPAAMAATLKQTLLDELARLERVDVATLLEQRYQRLRSYGAYETA